MRFAESTLKLMLALAMILGGAWVQADQSRAALVIGNGAYATAPLKNPVNDAADMAAKLRGLGFDPRRRIAAGSLDAGEPQRPRSPSARTWRTIWSTSTASWWVRPDRKRMRSDRASTRCEWKRKVGGLLSRESFWMLVTRKSCGHIWHLYDNSGELEVTVHERQKSP